MDISHYLPKLVSYDRPTGQRLLHVNAAVEHRVFFLVVGFPFAEEIFAVHNIPARGSDFKTRWFMMILLSVPILIYLVLKR